MGNPFDENELCNSCGCHEALHDEVVTFSGDIDYVCPLAPDDMNALTHAQVLANIILSDTPDELFRRENFDINAHDPYKRGFM